MEFTDILGIVFAGFSPDAVRMAVLLVILIFAVLDHFKVEKLWTDYLQRTGARKK